MIDGGGDPVLDRAHVQARVDDWLRRLDGLMDGIRRWAEAHGHAVSEAPPVPLHESVMVDSDMGPVDMPHVTVSSSGNRTIEVVPRGLWMIGANGRIDVRTPDGVLMIIDRSRGFGKDPEWTLYHAGIRRDGVPFEPGMLDRYMA